MAEDERPRPPHGKTLGGQEAQNGAQIGVGIGGKILVTGGQAIQIIGRGVSHKRKKRRRRADDERWMPLRIEVTKESGMASKARIPKMQLDQMVKQLTCTMDATLLR